MNNFLIFHLEAAIVLAVIYVFYRVFLRNETFFTLNRFVLLSSLPLAFILPLIDIQVGTSAVNTTVQAFTLPAINVSEIPVQATSEESSTPIFLYVYLAGIALFLIHALYGFVSIFRLKRKAKRQTSDQSNIFLVDKGHSFSFFRMIFLNRAHHSPKDLEQIKAHEQVHVREHHSVDALLIHLVIIFQWFNPFVWLLKYAIYENHEFIADRETSREATDYKYQDLMLKQAAGIPLSTLVHPFNKLSLKRRFKMLLKTQSNKRNLLKYLLLIPVAGALFWGISCENKGNSSLSVEDKDWAEKVVSSMMDKQEGKELVAYMSEKGSHQAFFFNVKEPEGHPKPENQQFLKGSQTVQEYLNNEIQYPEEAKVNNISGIVYAYFEIDRKGKVQNARIIDGISESFDTEVLDAIINMPDWEPAHSMGKNLVMQMLMPVSFAQITTEDDAKKYVQRVGLPSNLINDEKKSGQKQKTYLVVEEQPSFPGGEKARVQYLADNIDYPNKAREEGIQGTVYVTFVVEQDGSIADVRVLRGIGGGCDKEALEVVENMPDWKPGKKDGEAVRTQFNMPIRFTLSENGE